MTTLEQMGMASQIHGLQLAVDVIEKELRYLRQQLADAQNGAAAKRGRPTNASKFNSWANLSPEESAARKKVLSDAQRAVRGLKPKPNGHLVNGWPADADERKKEMQRRMKLWGKNSTLAERQARTAKARATLAAKQAAAKKVQRTNNAGWATMTAAQRAARIKNAAEARAKSQAAKRAAA